MGGWARKARPLSLAEPSGRVALSLRLAGVLDGPYGNGSWRHAKVQPLSVRRLFARCGRCAQPRDAYSFLHLPFGLVSAPKVNGHPNARGPGTPRR